MKFKFKIQEYQTKAVNSVIEVFNGQPMIDNVRYTRDLGIIRKPKEIETNVTTTAMGVAEKISFYGEIDKEISNKEIEEDIEDSDGFENAEIVLSDSQILENIINIQNQRNIKESKSLVKHLGRCSLDIEMETGTGKT